MKIDDLRRNIAQLNSKIEQIGKKSDEEDAKSMDSRNTDCKKLYK